MGFSMMSFQPAAHVGDDRRWKESYTAVDVDAVWAQLEAGLGRTVPYQAVEFGDPRCNRLGFGFLADATFDTGLTGTPTRRPAQEEADRPGQRKGEGPA